MAKEIHDKYWYGKSKYYTAKRVVNIYKKMIQEFIKEVTK